MLEIYSFISEKRLKTHKMSFFYAQNTKILLYYIGISVGINKLEPAEDIKKQSFCPRTVYNYVIIM